MQDRRAMEELIAQSRVCRLGLADGDQPYVIPMNFAYAGDRVYLHSALQGRKLDILRKNRKVCLEFDECLEIVPADRPCDTSCRYRSVLAFGEAEILTEAADRREALRLITRRYTSHAGDFEDRDLASVAVIRITVTGMSGKAAGGGGG